MAIGSMAVDPRPGEPYWQTTRHRISLARPLVMGIVNVTPDSFSDGGAYVDPAHALAHCEALIADGADILDIGGESSRPGADAVSVDEELRRILPVLRSAASLGCALSIDTAKPEVMRAALDAGVDIVNDIRALQAPGALQVVAAHPACGVCVMHMQGEPRSMQHAPQYDDVVTEVRNFLAERARALHDAGVARDRIVLDAGFGFGKTSAQNVQLLRRHAELTTIGFPLLAGWSRKSTLGVLTGRPTGDRLAASIAAALASVMHGAAVVRVHDVAQTVDALKVWGAAGLLPSMPAVAGGRSSAAKVAQHGPFQP